MIEINPEDVLTWESKKLWNTINTLKNNENTKIDIEIYEQIKFGIYLKCSIWYITEEWYEIYPSSRKIKIQGHGKYWLKDFMQEKENRDNLMRNMILENIDSNGIIEGRV